jgi:hypothetical protein
MSSRSIPKTRRSPAMGLLPLLIAGLGIFLLLVNFLLLPPVNLIALSPLLLVILGAVMLVNGDVSAARSSHAFGITRGSVQSATLEISAGEVDVSIGSLPASVSDRLIAGQYALDARPALALEGTHANLALRRNVLGLPTTLEWDLGLAQDLPWDVFLSTNIGQAEVDLSELVIHHAELNTGLGTIRLVLPREALDEIVVRSQAGIVQVIAPHGAYVAVHLPTGRRLMDRHVDESRYVALQEDLYVTGAASEPGVEPVRVQIRGTFASIYLS